MCNQNPGHLSEEMKIAILNEQSKLLLQQQERAEKTRRNHIVSVFVALFFGLTGLYPSKIDAFGIEINHFPAISFYIFLSILIFYMYWSYQTHRKTATISRRMVNYMYNEVISFDHGKIIGQFISPYETAVYRAWQNYMPLVISILTVLVCLSRALYEAIQRGQQP